MGPFTVGEIVLVHFPFSDLTQSKMRPAVCLAPAEFGDWVLCQITSTAKGDRIAEPLDAQDFLHGKLDRHSFARPDKIFTANDALIVRSLGMLNPAARIRVALAVIAVFYPATLP